MLSNMYKLQAFKEQLEAEEAEKNKLDGELASKDEDDSSAMLTNAASVDVNGTESEAADDADGNTTDDRSVSEDEDNWHPMKEHKYVIVSHVGFLIGVNEKYFSDADNRMTIEILRKLNANKNARIVRNLCRLRTAIELNFRKINIAMGTASRDVFNMSEYVPVDAVNALIADGVRLKHKPGQPTAMYVVELNSFISDRINNCRNLFPDWINWEYIRELFIMPDGLTIKGTAESAKDYYMNLNSYPFHCYMNMPFMENSGNVLFNDRKFVGLLYKWHGAEFRDLSKVMDASSFIKTSIYDFVREAQRLAFIVDCENSDVYKIISMLTGLDWEEHLEKIDRLILINDEHTNLGWQELENVTRLPVEHVMVDRVKSDKSLVDGTLMVKVCEEFFANKVDSFVLLSSDSDYWALINNLKKARFLVMVEHEKCGPDLKQALADEGIFYCYLDDFYSGEEADDLKRSIILKQMDNYFEDISFNVNELFDDTLLALRINMTNTQKKQFNIKYFKSLQLAMDDDGNVRIEFKNKN